MRSIGIVGCGAIGRELLRAAAAGRLPVPVAGVASRTEASARAFLATLPSPPPLLSLQELCLRAGLIVEAAGVPAVAPLAEAAFAAGADLMVISAGALLDQPQVIARARAAGRRLFVPS
ncbi:MAG TPA: aspartate dehydrogenase, partial [Dehalococcoidia bacterium]